MACIYCKVEGNVQGVFFRVSTQQQALRQQIRGWVKNCSDGSVKLQACGDEDALNRLEAWLWEGPPYATVRKVSCEFMNQSDCELEDNFVII